MDITNGYLIGLIVFCIGLGVLVVSQDITSFQELASFLTLKTEQHTEDTVIWSTIE